MRETKRMTAVVALKVQRGLVLGVDGRITAGGAICSEVTPKWIVQGPLVAAFSGDLSAIQATQRLWQVEEPTDIESCAVLLPRKSQGEWTCILFNQENRELVSLGSDGSLVPCDPFGVAGAGEDTVYGFLRAQNRLPQDYRKARLLVRDALTVAGERNATVGGEHHLVTVKPGQRPRIDWYRGGKYVEWLNTSAYSRKEKLAAKAARRLRKRSWLEG